MTKKKKIDLSGSGALTHSPFAGLRSGTNGSSGVQGNSSGVQGKPSAASGDDSRAAVEQRADTHENYRLGGDAVVWHERKGRGGKTVTIASWREGARPAIATVEGLARELSRRLGSRARVEDGAIVVQGELVERLAGILESEHGVRVTRGTV